jgi:hypothetical protein
MGLSLLQKINPHDDVSRNLLSEVRAYCADKGVPIRERWHAFTMARSVLITDPALYIQHYKTLEDNMTRFNWFEDMGIEKYQLVDNVDIIEMLTDELDYEGSRLTKQQIEELKEEMLQSGIRYWRFDW